MHMYKGAFAASVAVAVVLVCSVPIFTAFEFGADEGMELGKALQLAGPSSWHEGLWNDQPLLLDDLYTMAFRLFGPHAGAARLITVTFFVLLLVALASFVPRDGSGRTAGIVIAWTTIAALPFTLQLSVSAMKELPTVALAAASLALLQPSDSPFGLKTLALSGGLFGAAIEVKFTSLLFFPAVASAFAFRLLGKGGTGIARSDLAEWARKCSTWATACVIVIASVQAIHPEWSAAQALHSHFGSRTQTYSQIENSYKISWLSVTESYWVWPVLFFGCLVSGLIGRWHRLVPSIVLLLTVTCVHAMHRPWWYYYQLHFWVAIAMLSGPCGQVLWSCLMPSANALGLGLGRAYGPSFVASLAALSLWVSGSLSSGRKALITLHSVSRTKESVVVAQMRHYASRTRWVFTRSNIHAFHAGLPIPPKLLLLVKKRFWSGQITEGEVVADVVKTAPEQLLLSQSIELREKCWRELLATNYTRVVSEGEEVLFVDRRLSPKPVPEDKRASHLLDMLGLRVKNNAGENVPKVAR